MLSLDEFKPEKESLAKQGVCEGSCEPHSGETKCVHVVHKKTGHDWGYFSYCENAIEEDKMRGMLVNIES